MSGSPTSSEVTCPSCAAAAYAVIPREATPVETGATDGVDHDGKVWTTCSSCDDRFVVYYRIDDRDSDYIHD